MLTEFLRNVGPLSLLAVFLLVLSGKTLAQSTEPLDTIRVDSDLVDLKVSVISSGGQTEPGTLAQKDFLVFEDGAAQEISFFAAADTPFDLILLLDLSGSTSKKINLIRRSAKRFVDATRPTDRVGIVTFTYETQVVSELTDDRSRLKRSIDKIEKPLGGTNFWDALYFVLQQIQKREGSNRRSAVVVMTDGVDNALPDISGEGSQTSFEELLKMVRNTDALVFPVYLDTEKEMLKNRRGTMPAYAMAREQLELLAQASGTITYRAAELKDLDQTYERVIKDLGTVYSIGYKPTNNVRDGKWRSVVVKLNERPDLVARTKSGYYAIPEVQSMRN